MKKEDINRYEVFNVNDVVDNKLVVKPINSENEIVLSVNDNIIELNPSSARLLIAFLQAQFAHNKKGSYPFRNN